MNTIYVEPSYLEQTAVKVESACLEYDETWHKLYAEIERLKENWKGKDNQAYTNQIVEYQRDFIAISTIMKQYAEYLRNCARGYREIQDDLTNCAVKL